jgi:uncharacterized protein DUF1553
MELDAKAAEIDPENRLLWRFNRLRLEGEAIRDSALAVSGGLSLERGGPPVYPPLPKGLDGKVQGADTWETSAGTDARRRSIYIFQRRAEYVPFLETFDAPVFNSSCERRRHSITALQALTMYDRDFVNEEAVHFADRVRREAGQGERDQIRRAFEIAFGRLPGEGELESIQRFTNRSEARDRLVGICRVLLNSNEFVYVD